MFSYERDYIALLFYIIFCLSFGIPTACFAVPHKLSRFGFDKRVEEIRQIGVQLVKLRLCVDTA